MRKLEGGESTRDEGKIFRTMLKVNDTDTDGGRKEVMTGNEYMEDGWRRQNGDEDGG
jgi:hypothetical protein